MLTYFYTREDANSLLADYLERHPELIKSVTRYLKHFQLSIIEQMIEGNHQNLRDRFETQAEKIAYIEGRCASFVDTIVCYNTLDDFLVNFPKFETEYHTQFLERI